MVEIHDLLGPTAYFTSSLTVGTVPVDAVLDAAVTVSAAITDRIPSQVTVGDQTINPAEFLYLMAQAYLAIAGGGLAPVTLRPVSTLPEAVVQNPKADPLTKLQFWTTSRRCLPHPPARNGLECLDCHPAHGERPIGGGRARSGGSGRMSGLATTTSDGRGN